MIDMDKTAEAMSKEQKVISISEFFEKNRHLLGYDNKIKALLTIVREGVDNALDATEEAGVLPDIYVKVEEIEKEKYKIVIKDNGPGIVKKQIANIFGKLLYGSKFHRLKQSRGQQGIGISGGVLYSQLTTGKPTKIISSIGDGKDHKYTLKIDVKHNEPKIIDSEITDSKEKWHGVQITFISEGIYREHRQSVMEYIKEVAISNPHANIVFDSPTGRVEFARGVNKLPTKPKEIKPHLYGIEVGIMERMRTETSARTVQTFLTSEFTRVGKLSAEEICKKAEIDSKTSPRKLTHEEVVKIINAIKETKLSRPPTDCLSPLGDSAVEEGLKKELNPEFVASLSRPPSVYRGWPFQVEVGIAYGGSITDASLMRFANRVPLLYQSGDCAISKSVSQVDWKRYGLPGDKMPEGPVVLFVHFASVWVPFTSESKEAIANYSVIIKEIKLALQDCARKLGLYLSGMRRAQKMAEKKSIFERYAEDSAVALSELTGEAQEEIKKTILSIVGKRWGEIVAEDNEKENGEENNAKENEAKEKESETEETNGTEETKESEENEEKGGEENEREEKEE